MKIQSDFFSGFDFALGKDGDEVQLLVEDVRGVRQTRMAKLAGPRARNER